MKIPFKKEKETFDITSLKSTVTKADGSAQTIQVLPAKVIEVGDDEAENGFSYKYSFINPLNGHMEEATDYLQLISVGEQIFDVGDDVNILFTYSDNSNEYTVTRQVVFPDILNKRARRRKILKIGYLIGFVAIFALCCCASSEDMTHNVLQTQQEAIDNSTTSANGVSEMPIEIVDK